MDDVIVIGAGPGGATAARRLAESGLRVRLLEKSAIPRVKPCGGALTDRALAWLPPDYSTVLQTHPYQWTCQAARLPPVTLTRPEPYCHIVDRPAFDAWLTRHAETAGAVILTEYPVIGLEEESDGVRVMTARGPFEARYVIAADGGQGPSRRLSGLPRPRMGAALEAEVPVSPTFYDRFRDRVEIHFTEIPWGYAWVIPRSPILNVGVGSFRAEGLALKKMLTTFMTAIFGDSPPSHVVRAHPLPYRHRWVPPIKGRVLWVGDAAGLMDPFSAEGIYSALVSGHLAADAVVRHLQSDVPLTHYDQLLRHALGPSWKAASGMARIFYPLTAFWAPFFLENQLLLEDYLRIATQQSDYDTLRRHALAVLWQNRVHIRR